MKMVFRATCLAAAAGTCQKERFRPAERADQHAKEHTRLQGRLQMFRKKRTPFFSVRQALMLCCVVLQMYVRVRNEAPVDDVWQNCRFKNWKLKQI